MATPQLYSYRNAVATLCMNGLGIRSDPYGHPSEPALTCSRDGTKVHHCTVQIGSFCVSAVSVWELGGSPGIQGDPASAIVARSEHNPDRVWAAYLLTIHFRATASLCCTWTFPSKNDAPQLSTNPSNHTSIESAGATLTAPHVENAIKCCQKSGHPFVRVSLHLPILNVCVISRVSHLWPKYDVIYFCCIDIILIRTDSVKIDAASDTTE